MEKREPRPAGTKAERETHAPYRFVLRKGGGEKDSRKYLNRDKKVAEGLKNRT